MQPFLGGPPAVPPSPQHSSAYSDEVLVMRIGAVRMTFKAAAFLMSIMLTATAVVFAITMLVVERSSPDRAVYWSLLSSAIAFWFKPPSPYHRARDKPSVL